MRLLRAGALLWGVLCASATFAYGQSTSSDAAQSGPLRVALHCQECDTAFFKTSIAFVEFVAEDAEVEVTVSATRRYYEAVKTIIYELKYYDRTEIKHTWSKSAMWHEQYAKKIDQLPLAGVDPEMLEYGSAVSAKLRPAQAASFVRAQSSRASVRFARLAANASGDIPTFTTA